MCGFTGYLGGDWRGGTDLAKATVCRMSDSLLHRGPDDKGVWLDPEARYAVGHRRLSILDLSPAGHQPMRSHSGRYVLAYNGEIYNHLHLRQQLKDGQDDRIAWHGHSDTETLLAAIEHWGIEKALAKAVGMFALALWDRKSQTLVLARDRMGEKPLYFGWVNGAFVFCSELKAMRHYPGFKSEIDRNVLASYLRYAYVPAPHAIFEDVYKLQSGCMMTLAHSAALSTPTSTPEAGKGGEGWRIDRYWSLSDHVSSDEKISDDARALKQVEDALTESVISQQISDVPLGALLSGGVDSSLVTALMQRHTSTTTRTFTIGFEEKEYSEAEQARAVAQHLGTDHTELLVNAETARSVIPHLPQIYDEPFADSSQIPTFLVSQLAREHVTVALSGDGGDELFGGYNRYLWAESIWNRVSGLPDGIRDGLGALATNSGGISDRAGTLLNKLLPDKQKIALSGEKVRKFGERIKGATSVEDFYLNLLSQWSDPNSLLPASLEVKTLLDHRKNWPNTDSFQHQMMYLDAMTYLPDDILCKVDRAAMSVSLETRVPMLDHRVVETAWKLPMNMKIRNGQGKWALRQILYQYVPRELIDRPKQGFAIPLAEWLRGPLREWAEDLLSQQTLQSGGYFNVDRVRSTWQRHLDGKQNAEHALWTILMFQSWLRHWQQAT